ncbi:hypothetical protein WA026_022200 [Henosepilachna vigintioctopunctata]|uniref:Uncharacterized protein n=1 Tax=Henosepilachna vigintioctopunctata TaxID=420089 RepID=A0AAW1URH8_9CUCU
MNNLLRNYEFYMYVINIKEIMQSIPLRDNDSEIGNVSIEFQEFKLITKEELRNEIFNLPNKGSPDEITVEIIKLVFDELADPLLNLNNSSL